MKPRLLLIILASVTIFFSCGNEDNGPTGPENEAPILSSIEDQTITAGQTKNVELSASDTDGNTLTFSIPTNPGFLSLTGFSQIGDTATATLVISPEETITGTFDATIQVSDGEGGVDSENITIEVTEPVIFASNDLVGTWAGQIGSKSVTVTVNSSGDVEMSGGCAVIGCNWTISSSGKVTETGLGLFTENFANWGQASWDMQMSDDKKELDGSVFALGIGQRSVYLTKR